MKKVQGRSSCKNYLIYNFREREKNFELHFSWPFSLNASKPFFVQPNKYFIVRSWQFANLVFNRGENWTSKNSSSQPSENLNWYDEEDSNVCLQMRGASMMLQSRNSISRWLESIFRSQIFRRSLSAAKLGNFKVLNISPVYWPRLSAFFLLLAFWTYKIFNIQ